MMAPESPSRRRIPVWGLVIGTIVLSLFIAIGAFAVWFRSDADLRSADAAAKAAGVPATWAELGLVAAPAQTLAALNRLDVLATKVKSWQDSTPSGGASRKLGFGLPLPEGLAAHHAALPAAELAELLGLIDGLGDVTPVRRTLVNNATRLPEITTWRYICRLLAERVALASPQDCPEEARRLVRAVRSMPGPGALMTHLVRISMASIAGGALARRLPDLRDVEPRFAVSLRSVADLLEAEHRDCCISELLNMRETLSDRGVMRSSGLGIGDAPVWQEVMVRAGRGAVLHEGLTWIRTMQTAGDLRAVIAQAKAHEAAFRRRMSRFSPSDRLLSMMVPGRMLIIQKTAIATMRLHLLAAELDGTPWPEDIFAAPGTLLRRGERDGVLMFGYSVGKDGVDDGGTKNKDDCFPLYGPVEVPVVPAVTPTE